MKIKSDRGRRRVEKLVDYKETTTKTSHNTTLAVASTYLRYYLLTNSKQYIYQKQNKNKKRTPSGLSLKEGGLIATFYHNRTPVVQYLARDSLTAQARLRRQSYTPIYYQSKPIQAHLHTNTQTLSQKLNSSLLTQYRGRGKRTWGRGWPSSVCVPISAPCDWRALLLMTSMLKEVSSSDSSSSPPP